MPRFLVIDVRAYRVSIDRVLAHYDLPPRSVELVPSVLEWRRKRGLSEQDPESMSHCFYDENAGACRIVIRDFVTERELDNASFAMEFRGFLDDVRRLTSTELKLLHLLLREIACHTLRTTEQRAREAWAFAELGKHDL